MSLPSARILCNSAFLYDTHTHTCVDAADYATGIYGQWDWVTKKRVLYKNWSYGRPSRIGEYRKVSWSEFVEATRELLR